MKFGMPTLIECRDVYECCDEAKRYGLDFLEINMSFPDYQPRSLSASSLIQKAKENNLFFTIHADEMLNPFDFNERISSAYFDVMRDTISFAKAISARVINMHLLRGVYATLPNKVVYLNDVYFQIYIEKVGQFIKMCEDEIGNSGIKIAIENVDSNPFSESQLKALELFMKSDVFYLTLDTGHEMCLDFKDSHVFEKYRERLAHLHLHDSHGRAAHLPLGAGHVDVFGKLSALQHGDTVLIEVKTLEGLSESIEYLKKQNLWKGGVFYDR